MGILRLRFVSYFNYLKNANSVCACGKRITKGETQFYYDSSEEEAFCVECIDSGKRIPRRPIADVHAILLRKYDKTYPVKPKNGTSG